MSSMKMDFLHPWRFIVTLVCIALSASVHGYGLELRTVSGTVGARGLVLGENDQPIFAEFNDSSEVIRIIGEAVDGLEDARVLPAARVHERWLAYRAMREANEGRAEYQGATLISVDEYKARVEAGQWLSVDGRPVRAHPDQFAGDTRVVLVRDQA
ncbi:MAG: hypothetical protein ACPGU7_13275, partial [Gammaproteobacteria bacterium]